MKRRKPSRFRLGFERGFDRLRESGFGPVLDRAVDYRYLTLGLVIMLLILAVAMPAGGKLKFVGFPDLDGDVVEARVLLPQGTPLARTEQVVQQHISRSFAVGADKITDYRIKSEQCLNRG